MTKSMNWITTSFILLLACAIPAGMAAQEDDDLPPPDPSLATREAGYYEIVDVPIPDSIFLEAVSFLKLPDGRLATGTRRGEILFVDGAFAAEPDPDYTLFASGLHEVFGLAIHDGWLYATQQCELTRIKDLDGDGRADRFETVSDAWGFGDEHEYTFGSRFDRHGNIWVVCCLSGSYTSDNLFRGWCLRISRDGEVTPIASGIRSPGGVGMNAAGDMFYTESQGPWNGACSLKPLVVGGFMGHPVSNKWYDHAPNLGSRPPDPTGRQQGRLLEDRQRIPQLVPPAVIFPYRKMGQSVSAFLVDESEGKFGPFSGQMFFVDYTLSLLMRVHLEKVNGVYQGVCFPFRQGFKTGLLSAVMGENGQLLVGGCSRGWPARGPGPYALQRVQWTGKSPFAVHEMRIQPDGFELTFTEAIDAGTAADPASYSLETYTYHYRAAYGSPEIDRTKPEIQSAVVGEDGKTVRLYLGVVRGHVHELHLPGLRSAGGSPLLHDVAYYTVNEIP